MASPINTVGIKVGHATLAEHHTGCTVFLLPEQVVVSVDVRGPAPGSREAALMHPLKRIDYAHAILLTGGSAFGLGAADGVMRFLAERNIGHPTPVRPIPLVPTAVVYDLFLGRGHAFPEAAAGYAACLDARVDNPLQGNVGAGAGVTVGKWGGFPGPMKGGFGMAGAQVDEVVVFAAAVVNAVGDVLNPDGSVLAGARDADGGWLVRSNPYRLFRGERPVSLENTTLVVLATNVKLDKVLAHRLAQRAHDGMAQAIRPIHTTHDGDTAYGVSTGQVDAPFDWVANIGADVTAAAIRSAVRHAATVGPLPGLADTA